MRTFREVVLQVKDIYGMYEYKVAEERILLDVLEILYPNRELDEPHIATCREELEHIIKKDSITKKVGK